MKKFLFTVLSFLFCTTTFSANIQTIIFFGDSLSDNGNLYQHTKKLIPKSPPYYYGRFTNGPVWSDLLENYFKNKNTHTNIINYAIGGAMITHHQIISYLHPFLNAEINRFLAENPNIIQNQTLYIIWIGGNDYIDIKAPCDTDDETTKTIQTLKSDLEMIINQGGKNFLIFNLPDLSKTPIAANKTIMDRENLRKLVQTHNKKLANLVNDLKSIYPTLNIIDHDIYSDVEALFKNPIVFSQQFSEHISDVNTSCWNYSYFLTEKLMDENTLPQHQISYFNSSTDLNENILLQNQVSYLNSSTDLAEALKLSLESNFLTPCNNPDAHAFWDRFHPSAALHKIIAQIAEKVLENSALI